MIAALAGMARQHLAAHPSLVIAAQGHSMWPFIRDGQRVRIVPAPHIRIGDVVLVEAPSALVLHRVIALDGQTVTTKGDARPSPDGAFDRALIIGRLDVTACAALAHLSRLSGPFGAAALRRTRLSLAAILG